MPFCADHSLRLGHSPCDPHLIPVPRPSGEDSMPPGPGGPPGGIPQGQGRSPPVCLSCPPHHGSHTGLGLYPGLEDPCRWRPCPWLPWGPPSSAPEPGTGDALKKSLLTARRKEQSKRTDDWMRKGMKGASDQGCGPGPRHLSLGRERTPGGESGQTLLSALKALAGREAGLMEPDLQCHAAPRPPHLASPGRANPAHDGSSGSPCLAGTSRDPSRGTRLRALAERIRSPANLPSGNPGRLLAPLLPLIHPHASTRTFAPAFIPRVLTMHRAPGPGSAEEANRNHPALPASPSEGPTALRHRPRDGGGFRAPLPATGQGTGSFEGTTARPRVSRCPARGGPQGRVCHRDDVASPFLGLAPHGSSADTSPPAPDPVPPRSRPLHTGRSAGPARVPGEALAPSRVGPSRGPGGLHPPAAALQPARAQAATQPIRRVASDAPAPLRL